MAWIGTMDHGLSWNPKTFLAVSRRFLFTNDDQSKVQHLSQPAFLQHHIQ